MGIHEIMLIISSILIVVNLPLTILLWRYFYKAKGVSNG